MDEDEAGRVDVVAMVKVDYRAVWTFVHEEGLSYKKRRWSPANGSGPTSPATGHES
ncbi:hypothetical protein ILFOPFJJ_06413 [Ensifer psoraleae]|nr:hypothetical protein [Sinorhizobium psoraleae]